MKTLNQACPNPIQMNRVSVLPGAFTWHPTFVRGSIFCLLGQTTQLVCGPRGLDLDTAALNVHALKATQWCVSVVCQVHKRATDAFPFSLTFIIRVDTRFVRPEFHQHGAIKPPSNPFDHAQGSRGQVPSRLGWRKITRQLRRTSYFSAHLQPQSCTQPWIYQKEKRKMVQSDGIVPHCSTNNHSTFQAKQ